MKFYCIGNALDSKTNDSFLLLKKSCEKLNIEFVYINCDSFDITKKINFEDGDMLYRVDVSTLARETEKFIMDEKVITFYKDYQRAIVNYPKVLIYAKKNIPAPKIIFTMTNDRNLLKKYADYLGGFPLIIKAMGGSHGVGVMKIDSLSSLFSIADFLLKSEDEHYVMKEFIDAKASARLIVLGGKVIDTIEYQAPSDDFRSNQGKIPNVIKKDFSDEIKEVAIKATKALDIEFSGVDILIDKQGKPYVAEVNFPCYFSRCQLLTGIDISGMMLDYLVNKAKK